MPQLLHAGDLVVRNDTRVLPARLSGIRRRPVSAGPVAARALEVEFLLCHPLSDRVWEALARPAKRLKTGDRVEFPDGTFARVEPGGSEGMRRLAFENREAAFECMTRCGTMPLPPYVRRPATNPEEYQTSYAAVPGAVAAPTAGFHFQAADFDRMRERGAEIVDVTLHVGPGTFLPIRHDDLSQHRMHRERFAVGEASLTRILEARARGRRIVAIGTTSVRVLETLPAADGSAGGWTDLFIRPGHRFRHVDALLTNFHLPRTSLLVLVSAFAGRRLIRRAYEEAVRQRFRFYSFGDGMLIL
ncbi:MAG: tRNA preQ1(34) S-adenosylmethionine ribosyltransferase-isomerase QueA [Candidatus Wallbacteria bacterium]|nr:tRNA preQ1(34) S-adenosylmethionine ribosyltransferase-isomerase QueA [Candidatus Wallbacteria bacterium]